LPLFLEYSQFIDMAPIKVAINGCGRIGRLAFRAAFDQEDQFEIVHLNDLAAGNVALT
jgi:glyceraldehyde-3-phosphate dehydrogenase/erythrose-4-phosphate dehydrogenase